MELLGRERSGSTLIMDDFELIKTLDSSQQDDASETTMVIKEMLSTYKEPWLLNTLVDYYFQTGSRGTLNVLKGIKQIQAQNFFDKLHNALQKDSSMKLKSLMLLASIINEQASWLYQIVDTPLFTSLIKLLKVSINVTVLMSAVLTLTALLPLAPSYIAHHLADLLEVFSRLAAWRSGNNPTVPEVHLLHLDVAVYYYFVQLYTMYPCNFMDYLKARYGPKGEVHLFKRHIAPLLKHVRMHPEFVCQSTDFEKEKIKWCTMEPDEIASLSCDISLGPLINANDSSGKGELLAVLADASLREKLDAVCQLPGKACDGVKPLERHSQSEEEKTSFQHMYSWPKKYVHQVGPSKSSEFSCARKTAEVTGHRRRHSFTDIKEFPNFVPVLQNGDTKFSPATFLGLYPTNEQHQLSRHSSYISTTSSGAATSNLASPFCTDSSHSHNQLQVNYSPTASLVSYNFDTALQSSCTSDDSSADMFRYPDLSRSLPAPASLSTSLDVRNRQSKNLVTSMGAIEKQNPLKAAMSKFIGMISGRSSDQQKSSRPTSRSATHSPTGGQSSNDVDTNDFVEIAVDALSGEPSVSLVVPEAPPSKPNNVEKDSATVVEPSNTVPNVQSVASSENPPPGHHHVLTRKAKSFPSGDMAAEHLSPQDRLRMLLTLRRKSEHSQEQSNSVPPLLASLTTAVKKPVDRMRSRSITWAIGCSEVNKLKRETFRNRSSNSECCDGTPVQEGSYSSTPLTEMSVSCVSHNTLGSLDSASTLMPCSPTVSHDFALSESFSDSRLVTRSPCLPYQYHRSDSSSVTDVHSKKSPVSPIECLDQYIKSGGRLHHHNAMSVPLACVDEMDWDHFGGCPHQETVSVMTDQVTLLHSQLLFERNQCLQHAARNRRLLNMMHKSSTDREDLLTMEDQVHIMEQTVESKDISIGILKEKLRQLTSDMDKKEDILTKQLKKLNADKHRQDTENHRLQERVQILEAQNAAMDKDLMSANSKIFTLEARLRQSEPLLQHTKKLQAQVESLSRDLLVVNQVQQQQQVVEANTKKTAVSEQYKMMCKTYRRERDVAQEKVTKLQQQLQEMNMKVDELQNQVQTKDTKIITLENSIAAIKEMCAAKIKGIEDRYNSVKVTCKQQESYILELQNKVGAAKQAMSSNNKHNRSRHKRSCSNPTPPAIVEPNK